MNFHPSGKLSLSADVLSQEVKGETVLLDLASEQYFGLDDVGTRVWQLLGEGKSLDELLCILLEEYDVERERLESDISDLLSRLIAAGLVALESET